MIDLHLLSGLYFIFGTAISVNSVRQEKSDVTLKRMRTADPLCNSPFSLHWIFAKREPATCNARAPA